MSHFSRLLAASSTGGIRLGDIFARTTIQPTNAMLELARKANVPYSETTYDAVGLATYWIERGFEVMALKSVEETESAGLPIEQAGKTPALRGTQYEQGTRDLNRVQELWGPYPGRGVGLPTQAQCLLGVDVDNNAHTSGEAEFMEMCAEIGLDVSEVPYSKSPSHYGGGHLFFRLPRSFPRMGLPATSVIAKNVDLPWFVVAAGSWKYTTLGLDRHERPVKGIGVQRWYAGDPTRIPEAPKALLDKLLRRGVIKGVPATEVTAMKKIGHRTGSDGLIDIGYYEANGIPDGMQNKVIYRIACKMAGHSMQLPEYEAVERCWATIARSPWDFSKGSWSKDQVEKIVHHAYEWVDENNRETARRHAEIINLWNAEKDLIK